MCIENDDDCTGMADMQKCELLTEHGKCLNLFAENIALSNGGGFSIDIADASVVSLSNDKNVLIITKGTVHFDTASVHVQAPFSVKFCQDGSVSAVVDTVFVKGTSKNSLSPDIFSFCKAAEKGMHVSSDLCLWPLRP